MGLVEIRGRRRIQTGNGFVQNQQLSGGAQGTGERDDVVAWAHRLRGKEDFSVETALFEERTGFPPIAVCVRRTGAGAPR